MNIVELKERKRLQNKLTMVTCYDAWSAKLLADSAVDMLLVGDSAAMVMHGFDDTLPATIEMLQGHVASVRRAAGKKFIVADMPFMSNRADLSSSTENVRKLLQAGAHSIKLEGYDQFTATFIEHIVNSGVPVMGHLGLTPQFVNVFGGFRVQGRAADQKAAILAQARGLQQAGCFAIVLECVPTELAAEITAQLSIPTIGIGAGPDCDGQVLVLQDLLGLTIGFKPKFVLSYMNVAEQFQKAIQNFCEDVGSKQFPSAKESYE
jgi:3-methyl-2-oxobutanoate hydroxymethyltransferase